MRYGVTMFITDRTPSPVTMARALEERGFDALWVPEHTHIPVSRKTPYPAGEPLPEEYYRTLDPFVALAAAAAVTTTLRVATGVCLLAQRDPIITAKEVASLDLISGGRFTFGVGVGWNRDEAEGHGVDFSRRRDVVREKLLAIERLWSDEQASFSGEHVKLAPSFLWPKPVQKPRPPIVLGGAASPALFELIAAVGDGWLPIGGAGVAKELPSLRAAFERAGREPASAKAILYAVVPDLKKLAYYRDLGVEEVTFQLPSVGLDQVLPVLDAYAEIVRTARAG